MEDKLMSMVQRDSERKKGKWVIYLTKIILRFYHGSNGEKEWYIRFQRKQRKSDTFSSDRIIF